MSTSKVPQLKFRLRKNHVIDLGNGQRFDVPMQMREMDTIHTRYIGRNGETPKAVNRAVTPYYLLDETVFTLDLHDEAAASLVPKRQAGMSDRLYEQYKDQAFEKLMAAKNQNDIIRQRVAHYVREGTIEVLEDPFAVEMVSLHDAENAEADAKNPPVAPPVSEPETKTKPSK